MNETSGVLEPVVKAYLTKEKMNSDQISLMRMYLCQWINASVWAGPEIDELRALADSISTVKDIDAWLLRALDSGIDPL
jgi:hypothetical protein